jgi:DNA polymerase lambda
MLAVATKTTVDTGPTDVDLLSRNKELADMLSLIASYYIMARDTYRAKAFSNAAAKIAEHPIAILSGAQARRELTGIGDSIETAIDEYITTGTIKRLQELEARFADRKATIDYFRSFYGIGPVTAVKFYNQGFRTLEDLWFKGNLTDAQKIGIMWREHIALRIPRDEMDLINAKIASILDPYAIKWSIAGSYRRAEPSSGDIDVLVESRPDLNMDGLISLLQPILPAKLAQGPTKYMGIVRIDEQHNGHRIDIRLIDPVSFAAALLYFTGSQRFNILMRQRAIELGYTLNEYGLYDKQGIPQPVTSEEDIFRLLRVKYIPPVERTKTIPALEFI